MVNPDLSFPAAWPQVSRHSLTCHARRENRTMPSSVFRLPQNRSRKQMGIPKSVVDRLFDLDHHTRMNQLEAAFKVLGKRIGIVVENAA